MLPIDQYPDLIELSQDWNQVLDEMEKETTGGHEHYSIIGFDATVRRLAILRPAKGSTGQVPSHVIEASRNSAERAGMEALVGDIHTHSHSDLSFSLGDLYRVEAISKPWIGTT